MEIQTPGVVENVTLTAKPNVSNPVAIQNAKPNSKIIESIKKVVSREVVI